MKSMIFRTVCILALFAVWQSTAVTERARAAFPGANGKIAFVSNRDGNFEIYTMNSDGTDQTRLTYYSLLDYEPAWSPDGRKIAFRREPGGEIFVMYADGSGQRNLTNTPGEFEGDPSWSPDGRQIVYVRHHDVDDGNWEIYVMNADGSDQRRLTNTPGAERGPVWSPDGTKIAFFGGPDLDIYVMNADGSEPRNLTNSSVLDADPAWSPDGSTIVFSNGAFGGSFDIWVMNAADGTDPQNLTNSSAYNSAPAWSPDGTKIAFDSGTASVRQIYVTDANGFGPTQLTTSNSNSYPDWQPLPPDDDGDGVPDSHDVEGTQEAILDLPASAFKSGDPGHARAVTVVLDEVEALIAAYDDAEALKKLQNLRPRVDGCGTKADKTDWIVDCASQVQIRELIDTLIATLSP